MRRSENPLVSNINLTKRTAAVALFVEQWHRSHDNGVDDYGFTVRDNGLLCHHVTHVLNIPSTYTEIINTKRTISNTIIINEEKVPLVRRGNTRRTAFHGEHVDSGFSSGEEATETQKGADGHC